MPHYSNDKMRGIPAQGEPSRGRLTFPKFPGFGMHLKYKSPNAVGGAAAFRGAFNASLIFTLLVGYVTAIYTDVCSVDASGTCDTTPCKCDVQLDGYYGSFPVYKTNIGVIALGVMLARYVTLAISAEWSRGDVSSEFTLGRLGISLFNKHEPQSWWNAMFAILGHFSASFVAALILWGVLGTNARYYAENNASGTYQQTGFGMGAPEVSLFGHSGPWITTWIAVLVCAIRMYVVMWEHDKSQWSPASQDNWLHFALALLWAHLRAFSVAACDGLLVLAFGPAIGTGGFLNKDIALLTILTASDTKVFPAFASNYNPWKLYILWGTMLGGTIGFLFYLSTAMAKARTEEVEKKVAEDGSNNPFKPTRRPVF